MSFSEIYLNIMGLNGLVPAGVVTGDNLIKLMDYCKKNGHALPGKIFLTLQKFSLTEFSCPHRLNLLL